MRLRTIGLIATLIFGLLSTPALAPAQQLAKMPRIGYLKRGAGPRARDEAFFKALGELGWIEGQNIAVEYRWASGRLDRLPALAQELVRLDVDLIVTAGRRVTQAAKNATSAIPIVMALGADAVENGLVSSLAQPGGNVTGLSEQYAEMNTKLLELLHETLPEVTRVAILWNPNSPVYERTFNALAAMAPRLGLQVQSVEIDHYREAELRPGKLESLLQRALKERPGALIVMGAMYQIFGRRIGEFAAKNRLPVFSVSRAAVTEHFGLLAYGHDGIDMHRRAAWYVDKILKGAKPANLPLQLPVKFILLANDKTARQLGITIPPSVLYRADKVIQ